MMPTKNLILNNDQVKQKIKRMAFQILENNHDEEEVFFAGIWEQGYQVAKAIKKEVEKIASFKVSLIKIELDKELPTQSEILVDTDIDKVQNKVVIFVDDVLNTGRTFAYSLKPFLTVRVKKIETASLVNRSHTSFPISSTYTGYELSTTINDHIQVEINGNTIEVFLN